ncbi:MAG TPA: cytochrome c biogenesis protein CcsA [Chthoniobacteraceae bacterium]|jgi:ABC-type transport system involved in cytochrome c biogenesis permease subunit|nr:cytochrome c biogenesis protein CcsA [Chthoniobacteraceae bacterium]
MLKRHLFWIGILIGLAWLASNTRLPKSAPGDFDIATFGKTPVLADGRLKPLDTVARTSLVIIHGKQTLRLDNGETIEPMRWLTDAMFKSPVADSYRVFVINNPDVLGVFGWPQAQRKYYSFAELSPFLQKIDEQGQKAEAVESSQRSHFQTAIINLRNALILYQGLKNSVAPEEADHFANEIAAYLNQLPAGVAATRAREKGQPYDKEKFDTMGQWVNRYQTLSDSATLLAVPPAAGSPNQQEWLSVGASLLQAISSGRANPVVKAYALIGDAYRGRDVSLFNQEAQDLSQWMQLREPRASGNAAFESAFNQLAPFYQAMGLYVLAFLLVAAFWLSGNRSLNRAAFYLLLLALAVHTFGLGARMYLQGRPPVTNLYSSAIFIGWGTVIIGLVLERIYRDGMGSACASLIGFITLVIAQHLAESGDTMEMLQAVLDTNIWLATHVVCITIGYSAMFLAGMLAIFYVVRGVFTRTMDREAGQSLARMTYGVICFATLFSFVGTVLGGIWADQSWGRFWGWDPKENGALLIVLWCALILHARWGGYIRQRGLMVMALFGNVITSFSWFGVNMLGIGLHSYGFMEKAFPWLVGFIASQVALMAIAAVPLRRWRSFQPA